MILKTTCCKVSGTRMSTILEIVGMRPGRRAGGILHIPSTVLRQFINIAWHGVMLISDISACAAVKPKPPF